MAVFPRLTTTQFAVGAVASVVAIKVARPILVEVVRVGYKLKDLTGGALTAAKTEFGKIAADAKAVRQDPGPAAEMADLRAQVKALQTQLAAKKA